MEIKLKDVKKLISDSAINELAKKLDSEGNNNKILDNEELSIFEEAIVEKIKNGSLDSKIYNSLFQHNIDDKVYAEDIGVVKNKLNKNSIILSSNSATISINADFKPDGSLKDTDKPITGQIIMNDIDGKEHKLLLTINPKEINGLNGNNAKGYLQRDIIAKLTKSIDNLPQEVKNDLYNEVNQIYIGGERCVVDTGYYVGYTKTVGNFTMSLSKITLNILGGNSGQASQFGINANTLMHEIGHSIDELNTEAQTDKNLQAKFDNLKNILKKKNFDVDVYNKSKDIQGYFLKDSMELFAEYYAYYHDKERRSQSSNLDDKYAPYTNARYSMLHKIATSDDPEIKAAFKDFEKEFVAILNNSRKLKPQERKGNSNNGILARIDSLDFRISNTCNQAAYKELTNLWDKYDILIDMGTHDLLKEYYLFKSGGQQKIEVKKMFEELEKNNKDWSALRTLLNNTLQEYNAG